MNPLDDVNQRLAAELDEYVYNIGNRPDNLRLRFMVALQGAFCAAVSGGLAFVSRLSVLTLQCLHSNVRGPHASDSALCGGHSRGLHDDPFGQQDGQKSGVEDILAEFCQPGAPEVRHGRHPSPTRRNRISRAEPAARRRSMVEARCLSRIACAFILH
ncbi:hypothetical protein BJQ90_03262 [Arthrobacter sp. SO3]|nr:hypothetical protein [Arthrobacter sp. SO3]